MKMNKFRKQVLLFFMLLVSVITLTACKEEPSPNETMKKYVKLWNEQKFDNMYSLLSKASKNNVSKEDFSDRYEKIYQDINVENLNIKVKEKEFSDKELEKGKVSIPFQLTMNTMAGEIKFDHKAILVKEKQGKDEEEQWYVQWDTTYIFPDLEEGDKVRISTSTGKRGEIFDRNGIPLAMNGSAIEIGIVPEQIVGKEATVKQQLAQLLDVSVEYIDAKLSEQWVQPHYFVPIKKVAKSNTDLVQKAVSIDGVMAQDVPEREYPFAEKTAHLIGYISHVTAEDLEKNEGKGYTENDKIGRRGLEQLFEDRLRAKNGAKIYIEKADGAELTLAEKEAEDGETIHLTIDALLQQTMYEQMKEDSGTAAAIHPVTGEILALISTPSFDPNDFILGISDKKYKELEENKEKPLINRFAASFVPGSSLKPIVAAIGLENGSIDPNKKLSIKGKQWKPDDPKWGNYSITRVNGNISSVNLHDALIYSDNIYFAMMGLEMGAEKLEEGLKQFGFGDESIEWPYPVTVSQISNSGKLAEGTQLADTSYGQGEVLMNILHLATSYTPFVNNGDMILPVLEKGKEKKILKEKLISPENVQIIAEGLKDVVANPGGSAHSAYMKDLVLAGKTGTAELKSNLDEKGQENGFFVAYNVDQPNLLIAMMIENVQDHGGSKYVVEKVKKVFKEMK